MQQLVVGDGGQPEQQVARERGGFSLLIFQLQHAEYPLTIPPLSSEGGTVCYVRSERHSGLLAAKRATNPGLPRDGVSQARLPVASSNSKTAI